MSDVERRFHKHDNCACHISPPCSYCTDCEVCSVDESSEVGLFIDSLTTQLAQLQAKVSEAVGEMTSWLSMKPYVQDVQGARNHVQRMLAILSDTSQPTKEH